MGWLRSALRRWLDIMPPAISEVEEEQSTSRLRGYDSSGTVQEYQQRGRTGYRDDLIGMPVIPRSTRINLSRILYEQDARVKDIIKKTSNEVLKRGFAFAVAEDVPESVGIRLETAMAEMMAHTQMGYQMSGWHKAALVDGDLFLQVVLGAQGQVSRLQYLNPLTMQRCSNDNDRFPDPEQAFVEYQDGTIVEDDGTLTEMLQFNPVKVRDVEQRVRSVYDWLEVVHARVDDMPGRRYGRPLLEGGLDSARYARLAELDMGVRRKMKTAPRDVWTVGAVDSPVPPDSVRLDVMDDLERRRANVPRGRELDMVVRYPVSTEHVPGDGTIGVVADVMHHIDTLYASGPIPKQASGYMDSINRDVIPAVQQVLADNIETEREWLRDHVLVPVMTRMLWYSGIPVEPGQITVEFPPHQYSLDDFGTVATALAALGKVGLTTQESTGRLLERMMPEVYNAEDYVTEQAADQAAQMAAQPPPESNTETEIDEDEEADG